MRSLLVAMWRFVLLTVAACESCYSDKPEYEAACAKLNQTACKKQVVCVWGNPSISDCYGKTLDLDPVCQKIMKEVDCDAQLGCVWRSAADATAWVHTLQAQVGAFSATSALPVVRYVSKRGGDWNWLECPSGMHVIGGGCDAVDGGNNVVQASHPDGPYWVCGGHGGAKRVVAICSPSIDVSIVKVSGGDWTTAKCPAGTRVVGGGCDATGHPNQYQYSGPVSSDTYQCGGQGGAKTVYAICSKADFTVTSRKGGDWTYQGCGVGDAVIGGGCDGEGGQGLIQSSIPTTWSQWVCGGHGESKVAWATCTKAVLDLESQPPSPEQNPMTISRPTVVTQHAEEVVEASGLSGILTAWRLKFGLPDSAISSLKALVIVESMQFKGFHSTLGQDGESQLTQVVGSGRNYNGLVRLAFVLAKSTCQASHADDASVSLALEASLIGRLAAESNLAVAEIIHQDDLLMDRNQSLIV